ncbi:MAG TPA: hypothetical protein VFV95_01220 [Vicinamibacterales bacterium]|nr:hypothetical protein [Vicinamibacterales bacterium]
MIQRASGRIVLATLVATAACSSRPDEAPPVAAPTLTLASSRVPLGRQVAVTYRFAIPPTAQPFLEDYVVFVHAMDKDGKQVWTNDHEPPTPTRQWKPGTSIEYTQSMLIPRRVAEGHFTLEVGLYSSRTGERLPLSGNDRGRRSYQVAAFDVTGGGEPPAIYLEGWHTVEVPDNAQDIGWRWSTGTSKLWLRNPRRDATLVIDLDQPVTGLGAAQRVTVRSGDADVGSFEVRPGKRETHRLPVTVPLLGSDDIARLTLVVDRTFVPAQLPGGSGDKRELGVRVFDVSLEAAQP